MCGCARTGTRLTQVTDCSGTMTSMYQYLLGRPFLKQGPCMAFGMKERRERPEVG